MMAKPTIQQALQQVLLLGWSPGFAVQAALRVKEIYISESTCTRQIRLLRQRGANVEKRKGKRNVCEYRIARKK